MKIPIIDIPLEYTLKMLGLWPDYFCIIGPIIVMSTLVLTLPFQFWNAIRLFHNSVMFTDIMSDIMTELLLFMKLFIMWFNKSYIKDLLREIANDYNEKIVIEKWSVFEHKARCFCKFVYLMYYGSVFMCQMLFLLAYTSIPVENRVMLLKAYYPFDYKSSPTFEIMNLIQSIQGITITCVQALSESLIVVFVLHACGHIDLLIDQLQNFSVNYAAKQHVSIIFIIRSHLKVLSLVSKIESIYTYVSLAQVILSTIFMYVVGFVIVKMTSFKDIVSIMKLILLYVTLMWQIFPFCFAGQHLINKSEMITNHTYDTLWYDAELKEMKAILFILHSTQFSLTLSAGKFLTLSNQTYTAIIETSFSYLSALRTSFMQ